MLGTRTWVICGMGLWLLGQSLNSLSAAESSATLPTTSSATQQIGVGEQEALSRRLAEIERELQELKQAEGVIPASGIPCPPATAPKPPSFYEECVGCDSMGFHLLGKDNANPTVRVTGFMQIDSALFNQSATNIATVGDADDGADFRRTRLAATGDVAENVGYMIEFDFASPGRPNFMDVWMEVRDLPVLGNLRIGQFRQPSGMDDMTSVRELTFLERGLPFALAPFRQIGIGFYDRHDPSGTTWAASLFRFPTDPYGDNIGDAGGYSMATRATTLLYEDESTDSLMHLGADYALIEPSNEGSRFRNTPEVFVSEQQGTLTAVHSIPFFVDTGVIPTNLYHLANLEGGFRRGSLTGQAEWRVAHVEQSGGPSLNFQSAYGQIAYVLTGEIKPYNRANGVFGRVTPDHPFKPGCGMGAWETAARLSWIDLDDENIAGNRMTDLTLGLNWYLNQNTKFQFNCIHAMLDGTAIPSSSANIVVARAQVDF